ncbi:MAG: serine/threonine-protein phosphatase [Ruminococcaceae bacterium]|nr:serine/threonine-protein phosphatase [Oscillospiraceae bacterium]
MIKFEACAMSDAGKIRDNNEDNFYVNGKYKSDTHLNYYSYKDDKKRKFYLYAVCDGMGGESYGELASLISVKALDNYYNKDFNLNINDYINFANDIICDEIRKNNGTGIGTTFAALYINNDKAYIYNIGDTRVYLFRNNTLTQLSKDHTQAQSLVDMGIIKPEDMNLHKGKHKLTQHLGIFNDEIILQPNIVDEFDILPDDTFILCSDGITDMLSDTEICDTIKFFTYPEEIVQNLLRKANEKGGKDNSTVIVVKAKKRKLFI